MIKPLDRDTFMHQMDVSENYGDYSEEAAEEFYNWMYGELDGIVQVAAFPVPTENKSKDEIGEGKWIHARSVEEFLEFAEKHSGLWRFHVYSGINTLNERPEYGRGDISHIDTVNHVSFDIETESKPYEGASKEEVWWSYKYGLAQAKFVIEEYDVHPLVVMSENGIHLHFKANFPVEDDKLIGKQHAYSKFITQQAVKSRYAEIIRDKSPDSIIFDQDDISDVPRVMKVAGTRGIKSDNGRLCGIIHKPSKENAGMITEEDVNITKQDIQRMQQEKEKQRSKKIKDVDTSKDELSSSAMDKVERMCQKDEKFRNYWKGNTQSYQSRSEAEFAFILKMLNHDFSIEEIVEVMWASGMSKWKEETDHYRQRTLKVSQQEFDGSVVRDNKDGTYNFSRR